MKWFLALAICCIVAGCGQRKKLLFFQTFVLGKSSAGELFVDQYNRNCFMGTTVWVVKLGSHGSDSAETLLTVEAAFQERDPGMPHLLKDEATGELVLEDSERSYSFSLDTRKLTVNKYPECVYIGPYMTWEERQESEQSAIP